MEREPKAFKIGTLDISKLRDILIIGKRTSLQYMHEYKIVHCPDCATKGFKQVLGEIMPEGGLVVRRYHHGTTIIKSPQFDLLCGCGFKVTVTNGGTIIPHE